MPTAKLRLILLQIALNTGDILTTPWRDMSWEMNPLIQRYGIVFMCAGKVLNIALFTLLWTYFPYRIFRILLGILVVAVPSLAVAWNLGGVLR